MSQPRRIVFEGIFGRFQKREDGTHRIPGGDKPSIVVLLSEQGTRIEINEIEPDHVFYKAWVAAGKKRIYFPFDPSKAYRFSSRMKNAERRLAVSVQRYLLNVYANEDVSDWCFPPKKEKAGVLAMTSFLPNATVSAA